MSWIHTISLESSCTFLEKRGRFWRQQYLSPINNDAILGAYYVYLFFISWKINSEREKGTVGDTMHGQRPEASFFCNKVDWFYPVREVLSWSQFNAPYLKKDKIFYNASERHLKHRLSRPNRFLKIVSLSVAQIRCYFMSDFYGCVFWVGFCVFIIYYPFTEKKSSVAWL